MTPPATRLGSALLLPLLSLSLAACDEAQAFEGDSAASQRKATTDLGPGAEGSSICDTGDPWVTECFEPTLSGRNVQSARFKNVVELEYSWALFEFPDEYTYSSPSVLDRFNVGEEPSGWAWASICTGSSPTSQPGQCVDDESAASELVWAGIEFSCPDSDPFSVLSFLRSGEEISVEFDVDTRWELWERFSGDVAAFSLCRADRILGEAVVGDQVRVALEIPLDDRYESRLTTYARSNSAEEFNDEVGFDLLPLLALEARTDEADPDSPTWNVWSALTHFSVSVDPSRVYQKQYRCEEGGWEPLPGFEGSTPNDTSMSAEDALEYHRNLFDIFTTCEVRARVNTEIILPNENGHDLE